jgi:hypothetical protein
MFSGLPPIATDTRTSWIGSLGSLFTAGALAVIR